MTQEKIPNSDRWANHFDALQQYVARTGNALVPSSHVELHKDTTIPLGAWVGYMRQRNRAGLLSETRTNLLQSLHGWSWKLNPGPAIDTQRDAEIVKLRNDGASLQTIADEFNISRQRVHQITKDLCND